MTRANRNWFDSDVQMILALDCAANPVHQDTSKDCAQVYMSYIYMHSFHRSQLP